MSSTDQYINRITELAEECRQTTKEPFRFPDDRIDTIGILADALTQAAGLLETQGWPETAASLRTIVERA